MNEIDKLPEVQALTQIGLSEMLKMRFDGWRDRYDDANEARLSDHVTMTFRSRGDYFGYLSKRRSARGAWRTPALSSGLITYPVVERAIKAKTATGTATKIQTEFKAKRRLPEIEAAAEIAQNLINYLDETQWSRTMDARIEDLRQIGRYCWLNLMYSEGGMKATVPEKVLKPVKDGETEYGCMECGESWSPDELGIEDPADSYMAEDLAEHAHEEYPETARLLGVPSTKEPEVGESAQHESGESEEFEASEDEANVPACPSCGGTMEMLGRAKWELVHALTGEYQTVDMGRLDAQVVSPLLTRIDTLNCEGFAYKNADWFNFHPLIPAYELLQIAPHLATKIHSRSYGKWSESTRWHYLIANDSSEADLARTSYALDQLLEVEFWWIQPHACVGWTSPRTEEVGGVKFKEGQTIAEALEAASGETFSGLAVLWFDDEAVMIGNESFLSRFVGFPHKIDSQSFFPQGEENLLPIQDAATNTMNMAYSIVKRTAMPKMIADETMFDIDELRKNVSGQIITKKAILQEGSYIPWSAGIGYVPPGELPQAIWQIIDMIIQISKEMSGIFNETVGNVDNQETLGGRRMALQQSLGLQTPPIQSKAAAKVELNYVRAELWQKFAPIEAYSLIKGTFDEEWKLSDILAFKSINLRDELAQDIVEGTDIPRTPLEMESRYMAALEMGLFDPASPVPGQIRAYIVKSVLGIDFDVDNYDAYRRVAAKRYDIIRQSCEAFSAEEAFEIMMDENGMPKQILRPEISMAIGMHPSTKVRSTDQHLVFIEYYVDRLNGLLGAKELDEVLIAAIEFEIDMHRAQVAASAAQLSAVQNAVNPQGQPGQENQDPNASKGAVAGGQN